MTFLTVFGHTNIDLILQVEELPGPETSMVSPNMTRAFGGVAANISHHAASLGCPTRLVSFVGDDFPEDFSRSLTNSGVELEFLDRVDGMVTPTCMIFTDGDGQQASVIHPGPMGDYAERAVSPAMIEGTEYVHLTTGQPGFYHKLLPLIGDGQKLGVDPAQGIHFDYREGDLEKLLEASHYLICNKAEGEVMLKLTGKDSIEDLAVGQEFAINTMGGEGSRLWRDGEWTAVPIVPGKEIVDATGCGDSFRAGLFTKLHAGWDLVDAMQWGATVASFVIEVKGPQTVRLSSDQVQVRYEEHF